MPIMKVLGAQTGDTFYIPHPHRVVQLYDDWHNNKNSGKREKGCIVFMASSATKGLFHVANITARQMKRSIQENTDQKIGFLKVTWRKNETELFNRYINVDHVISLRKPYNGKPYLELDNDDSAKELFGNHIHRVEFPIDNVDVIALQLRRVVARLDQDEELCCAPPEEDDSEE